MFTVITIDILNLRISLVNTSVRLASVFDWRVTRIITSTSYARRQKKLVFCLIVFKGFVNFPMVISVNSCLQFHTIHWYITYVYVTIT